MIVPDFWAEGRARHRDAKRQVTVRRFGWSVTSQADAQAMADARARQALQRLLDGAPLARRELKRAYNGADGVPIREEVLSRHGAEVVTRNAYGAHCLNSPAVLFADIDFAPPATGRVAGLAFLAGLALALAAGWVGHRWGLAGGIAIAAAVGSVSLDRVVRRVQDARDGGPAGRARRRVLSFLDREPEASLRVYETPAGWRLLATHRPFDPAEPAVQALFDAVGADPVYARMCRHQHCFRARLTGKPWRMGPQAPRRPPRAVGPVDPSRRPAREAWVERYEAIAGGFAACRYLETLGSGRVHAAVAPVVELHDRLSGARLAGRPLA